MSTYDVKNAMHGYLILVRADRCGYSVLRAAMAAVLKNVIWSRFYKTGSLKRSRQLLKTTTTENVRLGTGVRGRCNGGEHEEVIIYAKTTSQDRDLKKYDRYTPPQDVQKLSLMFLWPQLHLLGDVPMPSFPHTGVCGTRLTTGPVTR